MLVSDLTSMSPRMKSR